MIKYEYSSSKPIAFILHFLIIINIMPLNPCLGQDYIQRVEIPSSPNPVGSGARALGMGGAFIAVADDATAASWNPGGLVQVEYPEISFVGDMFHRGEDNSFEINPEASGIQSVSEAGVNYLSATYPFNLRGYNMVVSVNYQNLYDFTREWDFPLISDSYRRMLDYQQEGSLSAIGIAYCVQIRPEFSLGFTLNLWDDDLSRNKWEERLFLRDSGNDRGDAFTSETHISHRYSFSGFNANLGLLWEVNNRLTIGAVLKTPFEADLKHRRSFRQSLRYPELPPEYDTESSSDFETKEMLDMPMSYGIGFAYKIATNFTVSLDIYRTEWGDFVHTDAEGRESSPVTGKSAGESDIDATHQIRTGVEYLLITKKKIIIPLCAGAFYDPAPSEGSPDHFFGFSIGSGIGWGRFHFDFAYQYRFGDDVGSSVMDSPNFSQDVREHTVYSSVIIHF